LQQWLENHGDRLEVLQLHKCDKAALTALPCCAKLQDLLLHYGSIASRTWGDIAAATKLTSLSLNDVWTASQQADVVAALTALPNLEQLTWQLVRCRFPESCMTCKLFDSSLLQQVTRLTSLDLEFATAAALQHLGCLTKLQHLSISTGDNWAAAGCPGLQELKALTSLVLTSSDLVDLPACISQFTALRQLKVRRATLTALNGLQVLTGLTRLCVWHVTGLSPESPPLKLPGLQHLEVSQDTSATMPMSFLVSCTQLQFLSLHYFHLKGPGSLFASTMLQHLEIVGCSIAAADGAADTVSWQQVFPGPGQLPHLTYLQLWTDDLTGPALQQADMDLLVEDCSNLKVLNLYNLQENFVPALNRLPGLTDLRVDIATDEECSAMAQLTGLRQLVVMVPEDEAIGPGPPQMSAVGLRQLTALTQLTSLGLGTFDHSWQLDTLAQHLMADNLPDCEYAIINKVSGWYCACARACWWGKEGALFAGGGRAGGLGPHLC